MTASNSVVPATWGQPSPWSSQGREIASIDRNTAVEAKRSLASAELADFNAALRKHYIENRIDDVGDVMEHALNRAGGDALMLSGLMEIAGAYIQNESRAYRKEFGV